MILLCCRVVNRFMKLLCLLFLFSIPIYSFASPLLYMNIKDDNVCVFTKGVSKDIYKNQVLVYIGKVDEVNAFHDSYSKVYLNLRAPIIEDNCILIPSSEFQENKPYDIVLETDKSYARRVCLKKDGGDGLHLLGVNNGYNCSNTEYDYSGNGFITKLKNLYFWFVDFIQ